MNAVTSVVLSAAMYTTLTLNKIYEINEYSINYTVALEFLCNLS